MHKKITIPIILSITLVSVSVVAYSIKVDNLPKSNNELNPIASEENESLIAFNTMMDVLTHQRCINCHPSDNVPKQGEDRHPHRFGISRANSMEATNCMTCHQSTNNDYSGVPGAPEWALAPHSMRWEGLSRIEIAKSMMNPENNGNRSPEDIMHHLTEHELVLWAWEPGIGVDGKPRELPPVPVEEYISAVKKWIELGAQIPEEDTQP
jgi:hypothetical protein